MKRPILVVDDDRNMCELLAVELGRHDFDVTWRTSPEEALHAVTTTPFDAVVTDLHMPGISGVDLCERISQNRPDVPVVVLTAFGSFESAVASLRAGAYDFVSKPVEMEVLVLALERALRHRDLTEQVRLLSEEVERTREFEELLGSSPEMQKLFGHLSQVADTEASVLITGESGTGKELVARALHRHSRRRNGPFVPVNCAAIPENLIESELFGHEKGAFTGATAARRGLFLQADGGTLLLDEVAELPVFLQAKLLRALEDRSLRTVGGDREVPFDVRVLAATNRDIDTAVEEGRFRQDLYFRLNVIRVELPPLRARGQDILLLAQRFLEQFATRADKPVSGISRGAAEKLSNYRWPGNVRELRNAIERAVAVTRFDQIGVEDLPEAVRNYQQSSLVLGGQDPAELLPMEEVERRYILHVLDVVGGNKSEAARILGVDRRTLYRKLERYEARGD